MEANEHPTAANSSYLGNTHRAAAAGGSASPCHRSNAASAECQAAEYRADIANCLRANRQGWTGACSDGPQQVQPHQSCSTAARLPLANQANGGHGQAQPQSVERHPCIRSAPCTEAKPCVSERDGGASEEQCRSQCPAHQESAQRRPDPRQQEETPGLLILEMPAKENGWKKFSWKRYSDTGCRK